MEQTVTGQELISVLKLMTEEQQYYFFLRACQAGNLKICQICLDAGIDINIREDFYGEPLLVKLMSTESLTIAVADWFIKNGANINLTNNAGYSPLTYACSRGSYEFAKYFVDKGAKIQDNTTAKFSGDLQNAVSEGGNIKIVRLLLDAGAPLEADAKSVYNPFITAVQRKRADIVELFLKRGAEPNFYHNGRTALHIAVVQEDVATARVLLKYEADVNAKAQKQAGLIKSHLAVTPLDIAIYNADTEMQQLLSGYGATTSTQEEKVEKVMEAYTGNELASLMKRVFALQVNNKLHK